MQAYATTFSSCLRFFGLSLPRLSDLCICHSMRGFILPHHRSSAWRACGDVLLCSWGFIWLRGKDYEKNLERETPMRLGNCPPSTRGTCTITELKRNCKRCKEIKRKQQHTTPGIRWWSPTQLLVWRSLAYLGESGRDPEFSSACGRMCLFPPELGTM